LSTMSTLAPPSLIKAFTTATCPFCAAMYSGVQPSCQRPRQQNVYKLIGRNGRYLHDMYLICDINVGTAFDEVTNGQDIALLRCIVQWRPSVLQLRDMKVNGSNYAE